MPARGKNWSIGSRISVAIGVLFVMAASLLIVTLNLTIKRYALEEARTQARIIIDRNLAVHAFYAKRLKPVLFPVLEKQIAQGYFEPAWMSSTYAVREINTFSEQFEEFDYYYKECAINARTPANEADPVEREFIRKLNTDASLQEQSGIRIIGGQPYFAVLRRGETMVTSCLRCHSTRDRAPLGLLEYYPDNRSFSRHENEVVSALSIRVPLSAPYAHANQLAMKLALFSVLVLAGLYSLQFWLHRRLLSGPLEKIRRKAEKIAEGAEHLGELIDPPKGLELRELVASFNGMSVNLKNSFDALQNRSQELLETNRKLNESDESLKKFKFISEQSADAHFLVDREAGFRYVNDSACRQLGYSNAELLQLKVPDVDVVYDQHKYQELFDLIQRQTIAPIETMNKRKDGSLFPAELTVTGYQIDGKPYMFAALRDITERKRNEATNTSRLHLMQFAAAHSITELLEEALNEAEKLTDSRIGFYHLVDEDETSLTLQSWSTRTKAEFCRAKGQGDHYPIEQAGVWVDCVHERAPVIHNDYAALPHRKGMPEGHPEVLRELVVPVLRNGKIKAILGVGNKPSDYVEKDLEALLLLVDLIWEIVDRKQVDEERQKLYHELECRVADRTAELEAKNAELKRMNKAFVGRELKMVELKKKIRELGKGRDA